MGEGDEVNGDDRAWECGGVWDWVEVIGGGVGVIVDGCQDVEGIPDDGRDGHVSGCVLRNDDVLNVADEEKMQLSKGEKGSPVWAR